MSDDYGALGTIVATAGSIMAAGTAIGYSWRGRIQQWEPSEQDLPKGGQKVGGLVAAGLVVLLWSEMRDATDVPALNRLIIGSLAITLVFLLLYSFLVGTQKYTRWEGTKKAYTVIGGYRLTPIARKKRNENGAPVQQVFKGLEYDPDRVWTRGSRQLAKTSFVLLYIGLTVSGTVALASAAVRLGLAVGT
jgi:hypothetical protein